MTNEDLVLEKGLWDCRRTGGYVIVVIWHSSGLEWRLC
jgi:hypothetical protein